MKNSIVDMIENSADVIREAEYVQQHGEDASLLKGEVAAYLNRLHPERISLRVIDVIQETASTTTFRLAAPGGFLPPFQAGQYITLYCDINGVRTGRPYSISSSPRRTGYYDVTVRSVPEGFVSAHLLKNLHVGDFVETSGPAGTFTYNPIIHGRELVFMAGGSGITPFMSMIAEMAETGADRRVSLFYGNRRADDVIFHRELGGIAKRNPGLRYIPVLEEGTLDGCRKGFIDAKILRETVKNLARCSYFICGPNAMYDFCLQQLDSLGIPRKKIRREMYGAPSRPWEEAGWPAGVSPHATFSVSLSGRVRKTIRATAGENLLSALERNGIVQPFLCRSGECSLCRVKLSSGKVFMPAGTPVRASDRLYGYIHSCVAFPLEDCELVLF